MIKFSNIRKDEEGRTEPVTLDEAKAWLLVDFADDDALITAIITKARNWVENYCNISVIPKDITLTITCDRQDYASLGRRYGLSRWDLSFYGLVSESQWIELPYGPVTDIDSVTTTDWNGQNSRSLALGTDYFTEGDQIKTLSFADRLIVEYETGYDRGQVPDGLRTAILSQCAFYYEQRGNTINRYAQQDVGSSEGAKNAAQPFVRLWL